MTDSLITFTAVYESTTPTALLVVGGISALFLVAGILGFLAGKHDWQYGLGVIGVAVGCLGLVVITPDVTEGTNEYYHEVNLTEGLKSTQGWTLLDATEDRWSAVTRDDEYIAGIWEEKSGGRYEVLPVDGLRVIR